MFGQESADPRLYNLEGTEIQPELYFERPGQVDTSGLSYSGGFVTGTLRVRHLANSFFTPGPSLHLERAYTLAPTGGLLRVDTTLTAVRGTVPNVRLVFGIPDVRLGDDTTPDKQIGDFSASRTFVPLTYEYNYGRSNTTGRALLVNNSNDALILASVVSSPSFTKVVYSSDSNLLDPLKSQNPASVHTFTSASSGAYGTYSYIGNLSEGSSSTVSVVLSVGPMAELADLQRAAAMEAEQV